MQSEEIRYSIGIQSFESLRRDGCVYVDKTGYFPELFKRRFYFMSRPRRFGKSLLLSTLEAFFQGKKWLFEGLEIAKWEKDWIEYPVIHIDFNPFNGNDLEAFVKSLRDALLLIAEQYSLSETFDDKWQPQDYTLDTLFTRIIYRLYQKYNREVVVLIDEYDNPLLPVARNQEMLASMTSVMQSFFNVLKSSSQYIKFAFITGVSRFRNTTLFSGANNLKDISMEPRFASLLGVTHHELTQYFSTGINQLAQKYGWSSEETIDRLRRRYDGYRFTSSEQCVYNPFSLLNAFDSEDLNNSWIKSGSTDQLWEYLRGSMLDIEELTRRWVSAETLEAKYNEQDPTSLLFQTGYLTISDYDGQYFRLRIPNQEVQRTLTMLVIPQFTGLAGPVQVDPLLNELYIALRDGDVDRMMRLFQTLLASVPYHQIDDKAQEKHLHLAFYIIFLMLGVEAKCEIAHAAGRVDMVAQTQNCVYVFEFKLDHSPEEALSQINDRGYALPWKAHGRKIYKIGVEYSSARRIIERWAYQGPEE